MPENLILPTEGLGRRNMMRNVGIGAAALGLASVIKPSEAKAAATATELAVLTFALNLEYLEAEYYLRGVTGAGLTPAMTGNATSKVIGGAQVTFSTADTLQYWEEIANDEFNHVNFLRGALAAAGGVVPNEPTIDLTDTFNGLAVAAGIGAGFDPFADEVSFLLGASVFEDVGVTAYLGGASLLPPGSAYLLPAAQILSVEAYHSGQLRTRMSLLGLFPTFHKIAAFRNLLSMQAGSPADDQGIYINDHDNITPTDGNSLAFVRTIDEVTNIVTAGNYQSGKGGFFPNGLATQAASA